MTHASSALGSTQTFTILKIFCSKIRTPICCRQQSCDASAIASHDGLQ